MKETGMLWFFACRDANIIAFIAIERAKNSHMVQRSVAVSFQMYHAYTPSAQYYVWIISWFSYYSNHIWIIIRRGKFIFEESPQWGMKRFLLSFCALLNNITCIIMNFRYYNILLNIISLRNPTKLNSSLLCKYMMIAIRFPW